jgi:hypothetical protein
MKTFHYRRIQLTLPPAVLLYRKTAFMQELALFRMMLYNRF